MNQSLCNWIILKGEGGKEVRARYQIQSLKAKDMRASSFSLRLRQALDPGGSASLVSLPGA